MAEMDKEMLIDLVRNEPRLWDQRLKSYHNRDIKANLWESIGKELLIKGKYVNIFYCNYNSSSNYYNSFLRNA